MSQQLKDSRQFRKQMAAQGYVYNQETKQYEQQVSRQKQEKIAKNQRIKQPTKTRQKQSKQVKKNWPKFSWPKKRLRIKPILLMVIVSFLVVTTLFDSAFWRGGQAFSILFVGVDTSQTRDDWKGEAYADAIIYATIEPWNQTIRILPINRDLLTTPTCSDGEANINHAYNEGGMRCLQKTVERTLGLPVDYYVETNFNGFVEVIDALGGISVVAEKSFCEQNANDEQDAICFEGGQTYQMTGEQALAYARHRKSDNLAGRQRRQEQVLQAVVRQAFKPSTVIRYPLVVGAIFKNVATNFTPLGIGLVATALIQSPSKQTYEYQGSYEVTDNYHFYPDQQFWQAVTELQQILD